MGFSKSVHILTFVISVIIISTHNCNAEPYTICKNQLTNIGGININFNGREAFNYIYRNIDSRNPIFTRKNILIQYMNDLYKSVILDNDLNNLQSPMEWCKENLLKLNITVQIKTRKGHCYDIMKEAGFKFITDTLRSMENVFYLVVLTNDGNFVSDLYCTYVITTIFSNPINLNIPGPQEYCQKYAVALCIDYINRTGNIDKNINATDAFTHLYYNFAVTRTNKNQTSYLYWYMNYLFNIAVANFNDDMFQNPINWCKEELLADPEQDESTVEITCYDKFNEQFKNCIYDAVKAFKMAFFHLSTDTEMNELTEEYYFYVHENILPSIISSDAKNVQKYCENLYPPTNITSADGQSYDVSSAEFSIDQLPSGMEYEIGNNFDNDNNAIQTPEPFIYIPDVNK